MIWATCHQIPSAYALVRALGIFYAWHLWQALPIARLFCRI